MTLAIVQCIYIHAHTPGRTPTHTQFQYIATQHIINPYAVTVQPTHYCTGFFSITLFYSSGNMINTVSLTWP